MHFSYRAALLGFFAATTATGFAVQGCASPTDPTGSSEAEHNEGEHLVVNDPHVWSEASEADFGKGLSTPNGEADRPVAKNDVTTVRLQQWLDRYHVIVGDVMRARGETLRAPKPTAAIFKEYGPNAWVSGSWACPDWNVRLSSGAGFGGDHVMLTPDVALSTDIADRCVTPINWTEPAAFASFFNSQGHACKLSMSGTDLKVTGCQSYGSAAPLATMAVSSTIGVTLDAITWGDELRVAETLAHELGHYYRAHANSTVRKHIDFFYRDTPTGPDRPVPAAESEQYEAVISQIRSAPKASKLKVKTRYSKRLTLTLFGLRSFCPTAKISDTNMRGVASGQITSTTSSAFVSFESSFGQCAKGIALDETTSDRLSAALRQNRVQLRFSPTAATVDEALLDLTAQLDEIDRQEVMLTKRMTDGQLGWYTDEQEADELGLELTARAGFEPSAVIEASIRTYEQLDALYERAGVDRGDEIKMATCKKWLASGFTEKDADGNKKAIHVPIGSLSDAHHEGCYRVYNMWREAKRHQYVIGAPLPELTPTWASLQTRALALGGTRPPALGGNGGNGGNGDGSGGDAEPTDPDDNDDSVDPEAEAPPPRRPKSPVVAAPPDAGAPAMVTVVRETGGCAISTTTSSSRGGLAALLGVALLAAGRRRTKRR